MLEEILIAKTLRVPTPSSHMMGDGRQQTMQLDAALLTEGFKLSSDLFEKLATYPADVVLQVAQTVLNAVRNLIGSNVEHNVYFKNFPNNIPNTIEFWNECIKDALSDPTTAETIYPQLFSGNINLLALPKYGKYNHSYEDMVAAHQKFIESEKDRLTILHLGKKVAVEATNLYLSLAGRSTPLSESDRELLTTLAEYCAGGEQPTNIPVRENRALINSVRVGKKCLPIIDTTTDILRLAAAMSPEGDVTLTTPTKFRSFKRYERRILISALNYLIADNDKKLSDVWEYREMWKRLAEKLHPNESKSQTHAQKVFKAAYADTRTVPSVRSEVEAAFKTANIDRAIKKLSVAPGIFFRNLDRILTSIDTSNVSQLLETIQTLSSNASGRVLLSVVEHLENRDQNQYARIFVNKSGRGWATKDTRPTLESSLTREIQDIITEELRSRISGYDTLVVDPNIYSVAIPLSEKTNANGFNIMPRGSTFKLDTEIVRFFCYWKQAQYRTDLDLSVLMLDSDFQTNSWVSWTNLSQYGAAHSGDIVSAPNGASEFIDIDLNKITSSFLVPQVNVFSGENFSQLEESFFGYMERTQQQKGLPFEAKTVQTKSDMRGTGGIALPLVFIQDENHNWFVKWVNLYSKGRLVANRVEANKYSTALLMRSIVEKRYLTMGYLLALMAGASKNVVEYNPNVAIEKTQTYVGLTTPASLTEGAKTYTIGNLTELIPS